MSEKIQALSQQSKVSLWEKLGFGRAYVPYEKRPEDWKGCIRSETITVLDWGDCLRLLVSRKLSMELEIETEHDAGKCLRSRSAARVLPPSFRIDKERYGAAK